MAFIRNRIPWKISSGMVVVCALLAAIVLTAFGFGRGKANRVTLGTTESANPASSAGAIFQGSSSTTRLDAAHITLRRTGFEPNDITRQAGRFLLAVDNVTGMGEMSYRLVNQTGARVRDFPATKGRFRLRKVIDLPPGRYALVETNHPEWICRITVTEP